MNIIEKAEKVTEIIYNKIKKSEWEGGAGFVVKGPKGSSYTVTFQKTGEAFLVSLASNVEPAVIVAENGKTRIAKNVEHLEGLIFFLEQMAEELIEEALQHCKHGSPSKEKREHKRKRKDRAVQMNRILDRYNDYLGLHKMFGDEKYRMRAEQLMRLLKREKKTS